MKQESVEIAVIGGGASGFFAAIACASRPGFRVTILEKSSRILSKVRISGGGRCNVTHACQDIGQLVQNYPRGGRQLMGLFSRFSAQDTVHWFESRGVRLKTEADGRMFPVSDRSQSIVDCLSGQALKHGVRVRLNCPVQSVRPANGGFDVDCGETGPLHFDKVLVAAGGFPAGRSYRWLEELGHAIELPVPSLFSFNIPGEDLHRLMGTSVPEATVRIRNGSHESAGPMLITHWGLSGPAILKLSSMAARELARLNYRFGLLVNWIGRGEEEVKRELTVARETAPSRKIDAQPLFGIPSRLWQYLVSRSGIAAGLTWAGLSRQQAHNLVQSVVRDSYEATGKTTFKEEFVTCGGISLRDVDLRTMESRKVKNLYFSGEVLDIDGFTGGFNFQAAWSTGFVAGTAMSGMA